MNEQPLESELSDQELDQLLAQAATQPSPEEQARFWQDLAGRLDNPEALSETDELELNVAPLRSLPPLVEPEPLSSAQRRKLFRPRPAFLSAAAAVVAVLIALPVMQQFSQRSERSESFYQVDTPLRRIDSPPMTLGAAPPAEESELDANSAGSGELASEPQETVLRERAKQNKTEAVLKNRQQAVGNAPAARAPAVLKERAAIQQDAQKPDQTSEAKILDQVETEAAKLATEAQAAKKAKAAAVAQRWADLKKILADLPVTVKPLNANQAELQVSQAQAQALEARLSAWSVPSALTHKFFRAEQVTYLLEISAQP